MTICHGLVGSIYFRPVHDNLVMDWLEVYTSTQSRIISRKKTLDLLEVYTSNQTKIKIALYWSEVYTSNQYKVILVCIYMCEIIKYTTIKEHMINKFILSLNNVEIVKILNIFFKIRHIWTMVIGCLVNN